MSIPSATFNSALAIIGDAAHYHQGKHSLNADGRIEAFATSKDIVRWSLLSAIEKAERGRWNSPQTWPYLLAVAAAAGVREVGELGNWASTLDHEEAIAALTLARDIALADSR